MGTKDPRVDAYIAKSAEFARPILQHLRQLVHEACPEVQETIKWSFPNFEYKGPFCNMAAFKQHCSFGFWKHKLLFPGQPGKEEEAMGQFGRIASMKDLPKDQVLLGYVRKAKRLNDEGVKLPPRATTPKKPVVVPAFLAAALKQSPPARAAFDNFSPSHKREYVEWLTEAKTEATRQRRLETALAWLAEGKPRNWKYMNC